MKNLIIIGAGGFAREIYWQLLLKSNQTAGAIWALSLRRNDF